LIDIALVVVGGILFLLGKYELAFWLIVLAIISGLGAAAHAIVNPRWYRRKRMEAGLDFDLFDPWKGIVSLVITKAIILVPLTFIAYYLGRRAGLF
jgi:hypothetical protein